MSPSTVLLLVFFCVFTSSSSESAPGPIEMAPIAMLQEIQRALPEKYSTLNVYDLKNRQFADIPLIDNPKYLLETVGKNMGFKFTPDEMRFMKGFSQLLNVIFWRRMKLLERLDSNRVD